MNRRPYLENGNGSVSMVSGPESPPPAPEWNIREYLDILWRRKAIFIQVFVVVFGLGIAALMRSKPIYQARAKLLVAAGSSSVNLLDSSNPIAGLLANAQPESVDTQLQVLQSQPFLEEAERRAHIAPRPDVAFPSVKAEAAEGSNVIEITVEGGDPHEIARLANTILDLHREHTDLLSTTGLREALQFIRSEKDKTAARLAATDRDLLQFRKLHPGVDLSTEREAKTGEYAALLARVIEVESNITTTRAQLANLRARLAKEPTQLVQETVKDNPRIAKLQDKLDDLQLQRVDLLRDYRPTSRQIRDLDGEMHRLQARLAAEPPTIRVRTHSANPTRAMLQARVDELETSLQGYEQTQSGAQAQYRAQKGLLDSLAPAEAQLNRLNRDRDAIQTSYSYFADRLRDLQIRAGAQTPMARAIERAAVPTLPIGAGKPKNIFLSFFLALVIALGTVFLQEFLDDRVNAPDEVESSFQLPGLAHVPLMEGNQPKLLASLPARSLAAESYRGLRTSIGFAGFDAPLRRLQVTSAGQGEGKSTVSVNLAISMAQDGKKVILVDADLRAPTLHRLLDREKAPGLTDVLAGMNSLEEALQATETENLLVLLAGSTAPNPAELLGSPAFDRVLQELDSRADVVICDTPPCVPLTDPLIVATRMDGVVLVLNVGHSRKVGIKQTVEMLGRARARIIGVVFNKEPVSRRGYYYQRYHDYGYGHYAQAALGEEPQRRNGATPPPDTGANKLVAHQADPTHGDRDA